MQNQYNKKLINIHLAGPRGFCAGVERAINMVEEALKKYGKPIYVRHEIVHNKYVVEDLKSKGAIFVDGRYTVQLKEQVNSSLYELLHIKESPWTKWIEQNLHSNAKIGYDPRLHQANWEHNTKRLLGDNISLIPIDENPIDIFWEDRPNPNQDAAILLNENYTGKSSEDKRRDIAAEISKKAYKMGKTIREICLEDKILEISELDKILDPYNMIESNAKNKNSINDSQLSFELSDSELIDSVKSLNLEKMTPLEAITKLYELKDLVNQNDDDKHRTI